MPIISINEIANNQVGRNLYFYSGVYYRLFANGEVNGWLLNPYMQELLDIDTATGDDLYGEQVLTFNGVLGTVAAPREHINPLS